ncbi:hypothetical protein BN946_scf184999.g67 [Trametes cinnabarina]|uniref:Uncharacterized protein n=1 Tax=Pycnoporus cinnabarinus TaxID=5643 RepID=A0A060S869_PYCCI|nr:hypothetical protein BN946_scf184999.g67 [Trametes cinnabarina]
MFAKKAIILALLSLSLSVAAKKDDTCDAQQAKTVTITHTVSAAASTSSAVLAAAGGNKGTGASTSKGTGAGATKGSGANKGGNNAGAANAAGANKGAAGNGKGSGATTAAGGNNGGDPQSSLTLLQSVIATGFENDGQDQPTAGQVPSLTSSNNFINFCATVPNLPITNGQQIKTGSCNPAPMGIIAATTNMPSSKFVNPKNGATIPANTNFTIQMAIQHLETGHFTNANQNYFAAPQVVNAQGDIQGHSHVVIDPLTSLDQTTPTNPLSFVFFKGLNDVAQNGILSVTVDGGLPAGVYRMSSINSAANHQPALVAVAQHGALDDMVYFTVSDNAGAAAGNNGKGAANQASGTGAAAAASATASAAAAKGGKGAAASAGANKGAAAGANKGAAAGANKGAAAGKGASAKGARFSVRGAGKNRRSF